jgi:hypothetical protein
MLDSKDSVKKSIEAYNILQKKVNEEIEKNPKYNEIKLKDKELAEKIKFE